MPSRSAGAARVHLTEPAPPLPTLAALSVRLEATLRDVGNEIGGAGQLLGVYLAAGKRVRASLALLPATVSPNGRPDDAVRYAAAIELIHAGTLCHDDVVDRCQTRRGQPSINARAGARAAAMAGLFLMWRAYEMVAGDPSEVRTTVAAAAARVAEGQAEEMTDLWIEVPIERYLDRQRMKTAALFELAAWLGARAARLGSVGTTGLVDYAGHLGLAFQLSDDLADLRSDGGLGRSPGTDLREGVLTLPVLLALADGRARPTIVKFLSALRAREEGGMLRRCRRFLVTCGAMERAEHVVADLWDSAAAAVHQVEPDALRGALAAQIEMMRERVGVARSSSNEHERR